MSVPKTDALPLGDAPTAGACPLCARPYRTSREKAQCRHIDYARPIQQFCNRYFERIYSPKRHLLPAGWTKRNRLPPGNEKSVGDGAAGILDGVLQPLGIEHGQQLGRRILAIRLKPPSSPFAKAEKGPQSVNDHEKARCRKPSLYTAFRPWPHFQIIELSGHSRRSVLFCCRYVLKQSFQKTGLSGVGFP